MAGTNAAIDAGELDVATVASTAAGAAVLGLYASWIAADILPRWLVFGLVALAGGYGLLTQATRAARIQNAAYLLAGLLVLTPVLLVLPDALHAGTFGVGVLALVVTTANLLVFLIFAVLAGLVAFVGYRFGGDPAAG